MTTIDYPDLTDLALMDAATLARQRRRDEARKRVRNTMPPLPELRFELAFIRSILPACTPRKGDSEPSAAVAMASGRDVSVDWRHASWIVVKDQGIFWGLLSMCGGSIFASMKAGLGFGTPAGPGGVGDVRTRTAPGWTEQAKTVAGAVQANVAV